MVKNRIPPQMPPPMQPISVTRPLAQEFSNMSFNDTNTENTAIYEEINESEHVVSIIMVRMKF